MVTAPAWNLPVRPLVLVVEGHEDTRALYAMALSANGFDVLAVKGFGEAYARAWEIHPDIIVTDLPSPIEQGREFIKRLKQDPRTCDIPVVAVSGCAQHSLGDVAESDGFAALFAKPCPLNELAATLRRVLSNV
jgi:two-component system cell cycle response regulator DivK